MVRCFKYVVFVLLFSQAYFTNGYNYDVNTVFKQSYETIFEGDFSGYDDTQNPISSKEQRAFNFHKETQGGPFYAFEVGSLASKG